MAIHSAVPRSHGISESVRPHKNERGFALLLIFLMASVFAITLYMEVPRVAMESERAKEALLIDRGEQYKRAMPELTSRENWKRLYEL